MRFLIISLFTLVSSLSFAGTNFAESGWFPNTPNEKITWDKLTKDTPMYVVESDATIVVPMMLTALLEAKANPSGANALIEKYK